MLFSFFKTAVAAIAFTGPSSGGDDQRFRAEDRDCRCAESERSRSNEGERFCDEDRGRRCAESERSRSNGDERFLDEDRGRRCTENECSRAESERSRAESERSRSDGDERFLDEDRGRRCTENECSRAEKERPRRGSIIESSGEDESDDRSGGDGRLFKTIFVSLRVPYAGLIILIGFIGGILFNIFTKDDTFLTITTSSPDLVVGIFLPALVFESAYRIEYHAFMKSLYSILLFSIVGYFISLFSISTLNKCLFLFQQWTFLQCLILGIILSATRPITLMRQADYGKTKRLSIILEGEAIINNSLAIILFNAIKSFVVDDQLWHTFKFFKTAVVALVGGIGFGGMAGILEIICLPHFYDDPISEVTITTAIPYMLYWLCEQLYSSGIIAIVVLGLILSNHKTALSSEAAIFMEKFWDMLALIGNTIIYILTALVFKYIFFLLNNNHTTKEYFLDYCRID
ncbi:unnamed protein product [Rotaria sp. Silwood1]|nr:unnamed protein product [Rotaria sp. Silwood1]